MRKTAVKLWINILIKEKVADLVKNYMILHSSKDFYIVWNNILMIWIIEVFADMIKGDQEQILRLYIHIFVARCRYVSNTWETNAYSGMTMKS